MCNQEVFEFQDHNGRKVVASFDGGYLSSEGSGALLFRELELRTGTIHRLAGCLRDGRNPELIEHSVEALLRQRIGALSMGYEDLNDHDSLRYDPAHGLMAGKADIEGKHRSEKNRGKALAGHSTLKRLEQSALGGDGRYKKIIPDTEKIEQLLIEEGVKAIPRKSGRIILDFDATDDPLHGAQEGRFFHGYYGHYCYLPLYCFCGNIPLLALLQDAKTDASAGTVAALEKIVLRGDSGFARDAIMDWCERNGLFYCLGLKRNTRLQAELAPSFEVLQSDLDAGLLQLPVRRFVEFEYRTLNSWSRRRPVVGKAEVLAKGENPRFVVTNFEAEHFDARALYEDFYCARGDMENRIKEQQQDLFADRTSTHAMASNQLRLWFSAFAHLMLSQLQAIALVGTRLEKATIGTLRLRLFKIAARVKVSVRRIRFELAVGCPDQDVFAQVFKNLQAWPS
ncbi:IS1380 family transposase [Coraliomargarita sp. SDUM461004]|uniref:IS1380 family transposase n=1 Tax=Thalassobacterium sedimentorum TaxID=3041258 RepID=A0ABU1AIZ2_9BACT|nr:IS1380 family transposase [Coraliomargarita sp. SDUM461004]MDQ8194746.1 IS1380 family transposase [Coraliomargarita sp. SDUM461004]